MLTLSRALIAVILLTVPEIALGQATRPTTMTARDGMTPRQTLLDLNVAMREGDVPRIRNLFLAKGSAESDMVEADALIAAALADLRRAAVDAFGAEAAKLVTSDTAAGIAESLARIEAAEIAIDGETATVVYKDEKETPYVLKKVDGVWRVPVSQLGAPPDPAVLGQRLADLAVQRKVLREVTAQIRAGKLKTAEQAREAWRGRILEAATSQPATTSKENSGKGE